jgi:hypothetical protein
MSYSPAHLQRMARQALAARAQGDPRWLQLVLTLSLRQHISPRQVEFEIERLANSEVPA